MRDLRDRERVGEIREWRNRKSKGLTCQMKRYGVAEKDARWLYCVAVLNINKIACDTHTGLTVQLCNVTLDTVACRVSLAFCFSEYSVEHQIVSKGTACVFVYVCYCTFG